MLHGIMTYTQNLWIYFVLLFGIIIVPGMDMFFVMANSLIGGRARGMAATAGIMFGGIFHTIFGAFFVGVIAQMAPIVLQLILLASASYMAWIGYTLLRSAITVSSIGDKSAGTLRAAFGQGFITCILNPKAYVFVLAVYPQFIQARFGPVWSQALVMGVLTIITQMIIYGGLGLAAAKSRDWLISNPRVTIWIGRAAGAAFILVGALTMLRVVTA
jgi:threonine/homoserine/homoserine lactone efflux protein